MAMFIWLSGRQKNHYINNKAPIGLRVEYTRFVCQELRNSFDLGPMGTKELHQRFHDEHHRIAALALVRPLHMPKVTDILSGQNRAVLDYWAATKYYNCPLVNLEFLEMMQLNTSVVFFTASGYWLARACSTFQCDRAANNREM